MNSRQARWLKFLQDFNYQLEHIPGSSNTITNLLSRHKDLDKGVNTEEPCILLLDHLFSNITNTYLRKTFLKDNKQTCQEILREIHNLQAGGHPKIANMWELVRQHYKGPRLQEFAEEYIKGCAKCHQDEKHHSNNLIYQHHRAPFNMYQWISSQISPNLMVLTQSLPLLIKDVIKWPNSFLITKRSIDQVLPTSIWNNSCPGSELHKELYLIKIPTSHPPFHKHCVII